jgi:hypothetical protein
MNRLRSGTVVTWRTRNARKTKRMETWCADFGLKPIHKGLHVGSLYESERRSLERKFTSLLTGKQDRYCIIVLCASCLKALDAAYETAEIETSYEIV